jgi:hypothetical protein
MVPIMWPRSGNGWQGEGCHAAYITIKQALHRTRQPEVAAELQKVAQNAFRRGLFISLRFGVIAKKSVSVQGVLKKRCARRGRERERERERERKSETGDETHKK